MAQAAQLLYSSDADIPAGLQRNHGFPARILEKIEEDLAAGVGAQGHGLRQPGRRAPIRIQMNYRYSLRVELHGPGILRNSPRYGAWELDAQPLTVSIDLTPGRPPPLRALLQPAPGYMAIAPRPPDGTIRPSEWNRLEALIRARVMAYFNRGGVSRTGIDAHTLFWRGHYEDKTFRFRSFSLVWTFHPERERRRRRFLIGGGRGLRRERGHASSRGEYTRTITSTINLVGNKRVPIELVVYNPKSNSYSKSANCGLQLIASSLNLKLTPMLIETFRKLIFRETFNQGDPPLTPEEASGPLSFMELCVLAAPLKFKLIGYFVSEDGQRLEVAESKNKVGLSSGTLRIFLDPTEKHWLFVKSAPQLGPRRAWMDFPSLEPLDMGEGEVLPLLRLGGPPLEYISEARCVGDLQDQIKTCFNGREGAGYPQPLFIMGAAGSGKTTTLMTSVRSPPLSSVKVVFAAFGGMAALNIGGVTIHSLTKLPILPIDRPFTPKEIKAAVKKAVAKEETLRLMGALVLDEVGSINSNLFDGVDRWCRLLLKKPKVPFGGVFLVALGDVLQLPTIGSKPFMLSQSFKELEIFHKYISWAYLSDTYQMRYTSRAWSNVLAEVRVGEVSPESVGQLQNLVCRTVEVACNDMGCSMGQVTVLAYNNSTKHGKKMEELSKSSGRETLTFPRTPKPGNGTTMISIEITKGDRVMLRSNYMMEQHKVANGSMGNVVDFTRNPAYDGVLVKELKFLPVVEFQVKGGRTKTITISPCTYFSKGEKTTEAFMPLQKAYSLTAHKVQGQTMDGPVVILLDKMDGERTPPGLFYVALGRSRDPSNIRLVYTTFRRAKHVRRRVITPKLWSTNEMVDFDQWICTKSPGDRVPPHLFFKIEELSQRDFMRDAADPLGGQVPISMASRKTMFRHLKANDLSMNLVCADWEAYLSEDTNKFIPYFISSIECSTSLHKKEKGPSGKECTTCNHRMEYSFKDPAEGELDPEVVDPTGDIIYKSYCAMCEPGLDVTGSWLEDLLKRQEFMRKESSSKGRSGNYQHGSGGISNNPTIIYAFNGGKFDWHLVLEYMMTKWEPKGYFISTSTKGSCIISLTVMSNLNKNGTRTALLIFKDLHLFLCQGSLSYYAKQLLGTSEKGYFPHEYMSKKVIDHISGGDRSMCEVSLEHFKGTPFEADLEKGVPEAVRVKKMLDSEEFDVHKVCHSYAAYDSKVLMDLVKKTNEFTVKISNASINNFNTMARFALYGVLSNLPKKVYTDKVFNAHDRSHGTAPIETELYYQRMGEYAETTASVTGGCTVPRSTYWRSSDYEMLKNLPGGPTGAELYKAVKSWRAYVDIVSMYVKVQMENHYPVGKSHRLSQDELFWLNEKKHLPRYWERLWKKNAIPSRPPPKEMRPYFAFMNVDFTYNSWCTETAVARKKPGASLCWDTGEYKDVWISVVDAWLIVKHGGVIDTIRGGFAYDDTAPVFDKWANITFNGKAQAVKDGNSAFKAMYKLSGNASYGISLMRHFSDKVVYLNDVHRPGDGLVLPLPDEEPERPSQLDILMEEYNLTRVHNYEKYCLGEHNFLVVAATGKPDSERLHLTSAKDYARAERKGLLEQLTYTRKEIDTKHDPAKYMFARTIKPIGAVLLGLSRVLLHKVIDISNPWGRHNPKTPLRGIPPHPRGYGEVVRGAHRVLQNLLSQSLYGDTDSLLISPLGLKNLMCKGMVGDECGQLNDELNDDWATDGFAKVVEYISIGPKCYAVKYLMPDGSEHIKNTIKGIPKSSVKPGFKSTVFTLFKAILRAQSNPEIVVSLAKRHKSSHYDAWEQAEEGSETKKEMFQKMYKDVYMYATFAKDATFDFEQWMRTYIRPSSKEAAKELGVYSIYVKKGEDRSTRSIGKTIYHGRRALEGPNFEMLMKPCVPLSSNYTSSMVENASLREYLAADLSISSVDIPEMEEFLQLYHKCTKKKVGEKMVGDFKELASFTSADEMSDFQAEQSYLYDMEEYWMESPTRHSMCDEEHQVGDDCESCDYLDTEPHEECGNFHRPGNNCENCDLLRRGKGKAVATAKRAKV